MQTTTMEDLSRQGAALIASLPAGETVTLVHDGKTIAVLVASSVSAIRGDPRPLGCYAGEIIVADDFNAPLPELKAALLAPLG